MNCIPLVSLVSQVSLWYSLLTDCWINKISLPLAPRTQTNCQTSLNIVLACFLSYFSVLVVWVFAWVPQVSYCKEALVATPLTQLCFRTMIIVFYQLVMAWWVLRISGYLVLNFHVTTYEAVLHIYTFIQEEKQLHGSFQRCQHKVQAHKLWGSLWVEELWYYVPGFASLIIHSGFQRTSGDSDVQCEAKHNIWFDI